MVGKDQWSDEAERHLTVLLAEISQAEAELNQAKRGYFDLEFRKTLAKERNCYFELQEFKKNATL